MALLGAERLTVDGVDLKTYAKNITTLGGTLKSPARRGTNPYTAGRSGTLYSGIKPHEESIYTLPMWVLGVNDDGSVPSGSDARQEFFARVNELTSLFSKDSLLDLRHWQPDGSIRQCFVEVKPGSILDFTTRAVNPIGMVTVSLVNHGAYFEDVNLRTAANLGALAAQSAGATAPADNATFVITGNGGVPLLTDANSGGYFQYGKALANGQTLTLDSNAWSIAGGGGHVVDYAGFRSIGNLGRLMRMTPPAGIGSGYALTLSGAAGVSVTFRRNYLVG